MSVILGQLKSFLKILSIMSLSSEQNNFSKNTSKTDIFMEPNYYMKYISRIWKGNK